VGMAGVDFARDRQRGLSRFLNIVAGLPVGDGEVDSSRDVSK